MKRKIDTGNQMGKKTHMVSDILALEISEREDIEQKTK